MATIQRNILIRDRLNVKQNAKQQPRSRRASDTVSPSVRGIRTIAPGVIGTQDRKYFQRIMKVAQAAGDALAICQKLQAAGDAAGPIDTITMLTQILSQIIDQLRAEVDAVIAKQGAKDSIIHPTQEGDPSAASGMDAAQITRIRHARFSTAQDQAAALGAVNPARIAHGLPDDVPEDVYEHMKNLAK